MQRVRESDPDTVMCDGDHPIESAHQQPTNPGNAHRPRAYSIPRDRATLSYFTSKFSSMNFHIAARMCATSAGSPTPCRDFG